MAILFEEDEAIEFGDREAIVIQSFRFWIRKNKANGRHFYDGHTWTYNDMKALAKLFSWWSIDQTRRLIDSLVKKEVLIKGNYNTNPHDRTTWYAFTNEAKFLREPKQSLDDNDLANLPNASGESAKSNWQNNKIELAETQNPNGKTAKYKETVVLPVIKPISYSSSNPPPKEFFEKIKEEMGFLCDVDEYLENRIRLNGWDKVKGEDAFISDFKFWEKGHQKKHPEKYVLQSPPKKPVDKKYDKQKEEMLSKIKFALGSKNGSAVLYFYDFEIENGIVKVTDKRALQYKDLLASNGIKIELL